MSDAQTVNVNAPIEIIFEFIFSKMAESKMCAKVLFV